MNRPKHRICGIRRRWLPLLAAGLIACSSPFTQQPTPDPDTTVPLTLDEPAACTEIAGICTLMTAPGGLTLAGTVAVPAERIRYTVQGSADEVISEDNPVTLNGDAFTIDLSDLEDGNGYTVTIEVETPGGDVLTATVVIVVNADTARLAADELSVYVSNNGPGNAGLIDVFDERFALQRTFNAGNNEGVEVDRFGNVYQAGSTERGPGIRVISRLHVRAENASAFGPDDREIRGNRTDLVAPKGLELAETAGLLLVADFGASDLKAFNASDNGNVNPVETTDLLAPAWDLAYDESADRLFVAMTDGTVGVYDAYLQNFGPNGPDRLITPFRDGEKISSNLHGIAYDSGSDTLIVTDVGAATMPEQPGFKTDGSIYAFLGASTLNGEVEPDRVVRGRWTLLGNPVDVIYNGYDEVRIAEKANDALLIFDNFFAPDAPEGEVMPDLVQPETKPESLVAAPASFDTPGQDPDPAPARNPDVTDIDERVEIDAIFAVSNTPESGDDFVIRLEPDLSAAPGAFNTTGATQNPENITFDAAGDAFITFDTGQTPSEGGLLVVDRLAAGRDEGTLGAEDRTVMGDATDLVAPKGLDVVDSLGVVIVADFGAADIKVFSTQADGNAAPLYVTTDLGGEDGERSVWDLDYDPASDALFAAGTDGTVLVYENYTQDYGRDGPARELIPAKEGAKVSANLHGIVHVADADLLILSDVGAATTPDQDGFDTDGALYVLEDVSTAEGNVDVSARVRGSNTALGNPVDLTFDGDTLFVAEKTQDRVLAFEGLLSYDQGDWNIKPSASAEVDNVESVALAPEFLLD